MSDLSIIVVSFDTRELTLRCLERIRSELLGPGRRLAASVTLVDNGSSDGTAEAVREAFPEIEVVALPRNRGFAGGCNAALPKASGRIVALLNSDLVVEREAVERCVAALDETPDAAVAGPQLLHPDGRLQNSIHAFPSLATELLPTWALELLWPARFPSKRFAHDGPIDVDAVLGAALFVRRSAVDLVGPLSEAYFFFLEETDWCWRMRERGLRVLHVPDARMVHVSGASSKRRDAAATRIEYHRSLYEFLGRHRGAAVREIVRAVRIARSLPQLGWLLARSPFARDGRERVVERWRVLRWHLAGCPERGGLRDA